MSFAKDIISGIFDQARSPALFRRVKSHSPETLEKAFEDKIKDAFPEGSRLWYVSKLKEIPLSEAYKMVADGYKEWDNHTMITSESPYTEPIPNDLNIIYMAEQAEVGDEFWGVSIVEAKPTDITSIPKVSRQPS